MKKRTAALAAAAILLLQAPALAEDVCCLADGTSGETVITDKSYVSIECPVDDPAQVAVTISRADGSLVYQRDWGECDASFSTGDIYLPLEGSSTEYSVVLQVGDEEYGYTILRIPGRMTGVQAWASGISLSSLSGAAGGATLLETGGGSVTVPVYAGGYTVGSVTYTLSGGSLTASFSGAQGVSADSADVQVALTADEARTLGTGSFSGVTAGLNTAVTLEDAGVVAVAVRLQVSFSPSGLETAGSMERSGQQALWELMQQSGLPE